MHWLAKATCFSGLGKALAVATTHLGFLSFFPQSGVWQPSEERLMN
jgi:hypothetical protein